MPLFRTWLSSTNNIRLEIGGGRILPCEEGRPYCAEPGCKASEAYLHHLIIVNVDIDRTEGVVERLDLQGAAGYYSSLAELKFLCSYVGREDFLEVPPHGILASRI